jgi:dimethylglycine dehydrogenase
LPINENKKYFRGLRMTTHARIAIVGGGMMGIGLLYHLAEEGCTDVILIEKGELTSGSTWHAAGQCPSFVGNYNLAKIHSYTIELAKKLEDMTGQSVSWHQCGGIRLATNQEELDWFHFVKGFDDNCGSSTEIIDVDEIRRIHPFLTTDNVLAGARTTRDGHVDPSGMCQALARAARKSGVTIQRNNRVTDIRALPGGEWEVVTENGNIVAEIVVNAAGCYARPIAQLVGTDVPVTSMEHQYVVTGPVQEFVERDEEVPVIRDPYASCYIRQEQKSGLIGIYENVNLAEPWLPEGVPPWESDSELFPDNLERIMPWLEKALERVPILADAGIRRVVNGAITHTPDGAPLLGPAAGLRNFWMCCGSSFGIAQGAGCGKYLAQWMLHGDSEINMTGMDVRRFGHYADESYSRAKVFQDYGRTYATTLPSEELPAGRPRRTSPLYEKLRGHGCVYTEGFGWERPQWFSLDGREENYSHRRNNVFDTVAAECRAVREAVGLTDLSGFAKFEVSGPDAGSFLERVFANNMPRRVGGIVLAHFLSRNGRIGGEATVTRLDDNAYYVLSAAAAELRDLDHLTQGASKDEDIRIDNVTDERGALVLAGPRSRDVLAKLTDADLSSEAFPWLTASEISINGMPVRALRVNYVGELGWELHPAVEYMSDLYDALWQAGEDHGIRNVGLYAVNSLRMEKAYRAWGAELTNEVTLLDADMERFAAFSTKDFTGSEATREQADMERRWDLVYLDVAAVDSDVRGGEPVYLDGQCVGVTTSGAYGHHVGRSLAFAYVGPDQSGTGTRLGIDLLGERCAATVLAEPVYDPENLRLRA